jgi:hypothetical protein
MSLRLTHKSSKSTYGGTGLSLFNMHRREACATNTSSESNRLSGQFRSENFASQLLLPEIFRKLAAQMQDSLGMHLRDAGFGIAHDFADLLHSQLFVIIKRN